MLSVNGLMRRMEIWNTDEIRPILEQVTITTRSTPAIIMFAATSKCVLFLVLNIFIFVSFLPASWQICTENEDIVKSFPKANYDREPVPPPATAPAVAPEATVTQRAIDINFTVTHVDPMRNLQNQPHNEPQAVFSQPQPAYNPYLANSTQKEETKF